MSITTTESRGHPRRVFSQWEGLTVLHTGKRGVCVVSVRCRGQGGISWRESCLTVLLVKKASRACGAGELENDEAWKCWLWELS